MTLDRLWAGWRIPYLDQVTSAEADTEPECVFCRLLASDEPGEATYVVWRDERFAVVLNAYPYVSGHLLVMPVGHVADIEDLTGEDGGGLWAAVTQASRALRAAYRPEGLNIGVNLGRAAGAGVPGHFHVHVLPRWSGDTNFTTTVAEMRVLPESLPDTYDRMRGSLAGSLSAVEEQVVEWAREELGLSPAAAVAVREKASNDPRCSPVVTELSIDTPGESPYAFHIERPLAEVTRMDVVAAIAFGGH